MSSWQVIATKTGLDRTIVKTGFRTRDEAWEWKKAHAGEYRPRVLLIEREEEKKPTLKEIFTGVTLDTWVERARVKGLNEFKNEVVSASPEQETLETPFVWRAFREWVKRSLREDADVKIVMEALDDIDKKFTYSEAQDFLMKTDDPKFAWIRMQFKDVEEIKESPLVSEMRKTIEGARRAGITDRQIVTALRSMDIELERPTSKGLAEARKEIDRLTGEIKALQREKIIPEWTPYWTEMQKGLEVALREYPSEEVYTRLREGRLLLDRAYANDPYVTMWLNARGYTVRDLEDEVMRLRRSVAGARVPDMKVDVLRMRIEVAEKEKKMPTLLEMETILEGAQKKEKWALERMAVKYGVTSVPEFEGKVVKLREEVGDPSQEIRVYLHRFCSRCRDVTRHKLIEVAAERYWECEKCGKLHEYPSSPSPEIPIAWGMPAHCPDCGTRLEYVKPYVYYCPRCERTLTTYGSNPPQEVLVEEGEMKRVHEVAYSIPILPVEKLSEPERSVKIGWLANAIDTDGYASEVRKGWDTVAKIDRWLYKWEYLRPRVGFNTITHPLAVEWCILTGHIIPEERKPTFYYRSMIEGSRAIAYLILTKPYLIRARAKAEELIRKYRERPATRIYAGVTSI